MTPYQRLLAHTDIPDTVKEELTRTFEGLEPVALLAEIRSSQKRLTELVDMAPPFG